MAAEVSEEAAHPGAGDTMNLRRMFRHLITPPWAVHRALPAEALRELEAAVRAGEAGHRGEIRVAVEGALDPSQLFRDQTARERALEEFARLRVWDTAENSGVLIYLLLADRQVEIVADRGIHARIGTETWTAICADMETSFRRGDFLEGLLEGLDSIHTLLVREYPASGANPNELPDRPELLR